MEHNEYMRDLIEYGQKIDNEIKEKYPAKVERALIGHMIVASAECEHFAEVYQKTGLFK